jgi:hypothetical protein
MKNALGFTYDCWFLELESCPMVSKTSPGRTLLTKKEERSVQEKETMCQKGTVNVVPKEKEAKGKKERCSGSYCQAVGFLVIKDSSISKRPG